MGGGHGGGGAAPRRVRAAGQLSCCPSHTVLLQVLHRADDMAPGEVAPYRVRLDDGEVVPANAVIVGAGIHPVTEFLNGVPLLDDGSASSACETVNLNAFRLAPHDMRC